ncbi:hypothetical protein OH76DRAFT_815560 [Lentinus brumalis]|uniref:Uncharacterized protein n=1 Tax=Lentinus brumalis TaxID=2498619 RepID=A0A371D2J2_9APHY|nr:hypothetical protein OH76DRAFT_815560 [Polyporus brumalis]
MLAGTRPSTVKIKIKMFGCRSGDGRYPRHQQLFLCSSLSYSISKLSMQAAGRRRRLRPLCFLRSSCGVRPGAVVSRRIAVESPLLHAGSRALLIYCSVLCVLSIHICHLAALLYAYSPHHSRCCTPPHEPTAPLENDGQCGALRALLRFPRASPYPSSSSSFFGPERWHAYTDYMQRLVSVRFVESFPAPLPSPSPCPPLSFVVCRLLASPHLSPPA